MMDVNDRQVWLDVYGIHVSIQSGDPVLLAHLAEDFEHFRRADHSLPADLHLRLHIMAPPYESVPPRAASVYTPRNVSFHEDGRTYIDYSGKALGILQSASGRLDVYSENLDLLYEVGYLFLLSQLGEKLDARHLHRIHAVAIGVAGRAALVLLPMGGGKSTLATHLLAKPQVKFLSDDSPLVDRSGALHAFPLRIGVLPGSEGAYSPEALRTIQRMEFGPKLLLRHQYFADRVVPRAEPGFIFLGRRSLSDTCIIETASGWSAFRALVPNCVIGLGLFQGMEFVFNRDTREIFKKVKVAASRVRNCLALVRRSSLYSVTLGRNLERNADTLLAFIESHPRHADAQKQERS